VRRVLLQRDQRVVLVFEIDQHRYGVDTESVHEIVRSVLPTRLPKAPPVILGLVDLRGEALPLIDLRLRFGLPARPLGAHEVFVIVSARGRRCALRADAARELVRVPRESVAPAPARSQYAAGTTALADGLLVICDLDAFLEEAELMVLDAALAEATP
jgi:purine-binding chemotaxis protein CheW